MPKGHEIWNVKIEHILELIIVSDIIKQLKRVHAIRYIVKLGFLKRTKIINLCWRMMKTCPVYDRSRRHRRGTWDHHTCVDDCIVSRVYIY